MVNSRPVLVYIKDFLWIIMIAGFVVGAGRFIHGLGAATNMTDMLPWGLWKVFNMIAGAALATSGFVVAATIYILQLDKFRPIARFSILIGFLGYGSSLFSLLFDIGLPHRGWHPFFMWNPHSFLFEVFWCVSVYWSITAFELLPLITERFPFPKFTHLIHEIMLPVVILGITLSTMHHSSLGSLFLASPTRLHPLWYSLWIPPEFFISAMGAGLSVIVMLWFLFNWLYKLEIDRSVLDSLLKGSAAFLGLYLVIKCADFTINNKWNFVFGPDLTWESYLFRIEFLLQVLLPLTIYLIPFLRKRVFAILIGTGSAFIGLIMHRINTGIIGYFRTAESVYIPNVSEFLLSAGILSGAALLFLLFVERFYIFTEPAGHGHEEGESVKLWTREETLSVFAGSRSKRVLIIAVIFIPSTWIFFQDEATGPYQLIPQPVNTAIIALDELRNNLRIDADRNGDAVEFSHAKHKTTLAKESGIKEEETCINCHHLNLPHDSSTNCRVCHRDMEQEVAMFNEENHQERFKEDADRTHFDNYDLGNRGENFKACFECHQENMKGLVSYREKGFSQMAPGYKHAMHGSCQTCHRQRGEATPEDPLGDGNCRFCHKLPGQPTTLEITKN